MISMEMRQRKIRGETLKYNGVVGLRASQKKEGGQGVDQQLGHMLYLRTTLKQHHSQPRRSRRRRRPRPEAAEPEEEPPIKASAVNHNHHTYPYARRDRCMSKVLRGGKQLSCKSDHLAGMAKRGPI